MVIHVSVGSPWTREPPTPPSARGIQTHLSAAIAGMMVRTKMETTEQGNLKRKRATIASPGDPKCRVKSVLSPCATEPPTPSSARGMQT
jgi:hypothetical protein